MYLTVHLTRCHRSKLLEWLLLLTTIINSGYKFLNYFACPAALYHVILQLCITDDTKTISLELFQNKTPTASVSYYVSFTKYLVKIQHCIPNYLRVLILSFLA
jgi:hypothetical protein